VKKLTNNSIKLLRIISFLACVSASIIVPMDMPSQDMTSIWIETNDGLMTPVERWQIPEMKTLLVLLEHQHGTNSYDNPLKASMISYDELGLLIDSFKASRELVFDQFFMNLAYRDGLWDAAEGQQPKILYTLGQGNIHMLVNAAERVEAQGIVALCASYYLPEDVQVNVRQNMVKPVIDFMKKQIIGTAYTQSFYLTSLNDDLEPINDDFQGGIDFSSDSTKICAGLKNGKVGIWQVADGKLLQTFSRNGLACYRVAFSPDNQMCAVAGRNKTNDTPLLVVWDILSGQIIREYNPNLINNEIESFAFNPKDSNQIAFSYAQGTHNPPCLFDIQNGTTIDLVGYDKNRIRLSFSPDGSTLLGVSHDFGERDIVLWDVANQLLIVQVDFPFYFNSAEFYGDARKIIIAGQMDNSNQRYIDVGTINNNQYVTEQFFSCDRLFPRSFMWGFTMAKPSFDNTKIALCDVHALNNQPDDGSSLVILDNNFKTLFSHYFTNSFLMIDTQWSPNDKWIALKIKNKTSGKFQIMLLPLLPEKKEIILNQLFGLTIAQMRLVYQLYCAALRGLSLGTKIIDKENELFMSIPLELRLLISEYLLIVRPGEKCIGNECTIL